MKAGELVCSVCERAVQEDASIGVLLHATEDGEVDHDADADHVPLLDAPDT